jgi:hypothetical protein
MTNLTPTTRCCASCRAIGGDRESSRIPRLSRHAAHSAEIRSGASAFDNVSGGCLFMGGTTSGVGEVQSVRRCHQLPWLESDMGVADSQLPRRNFLRLTTATAGILTVAACTSTKSEQPAEEKKHGCRCFPRCRASAARRCGPFWSTGHAPHRMHANHSTRLPIQVNTDNVVATLLAGRRAGRAPVAESIRDG